MPLILAKEEFKKGDKSIVIQHIIKQLAFKNWVK